MKPKNKKEPTEKKGRGLFDHIKQITEFQDPKYFDTLNDAEVRTFSNFMIHRYLSMNPDWVKVIAELQPYTELLKPKALYTAYIGLIPRERIFLRYIKGKKEAKYEDWLIDILVKYYECSKRQAQDNCDMLYRTKEGRAEIKDICEKYGVGSKEITKLKLKL